MKDHFQNSSIEKEGRVLPPHEYMRAAESHAKKLARLIEERELSGESGGALTAEEALQFSEIAGELNTAFQEGDYSGFTEKSVGLYELISPYGRELLQKGGSADGSLEPLFTEFKAISESLSKMSEGVSSLEGFDNENFRNMVNYLGEITRYTHDTLGLSEKAPETFSDQESDVQLDSEGAQEQSESKGDQKLATAQTSTPPPAQTVSGDNLASENIGGDERLGHFNAEEIEEVETLLQEMTQRAADSEAGFGKDYLMQDRVKEGSISDKEKLDDRARQEVMTNLARGFRNATEAALLFQRRTIMRDREGLRVQLLEPRSAIRITSNLEGAMRALKTDDVKAATEYLEQIPQALRNFGEGRSPGSAVREDIDSLRVSMYAFNDLSQSMSRIRNMYQKNEAVFEDKELLSALQRVEQSLKAASENGEIVFRRMRSAIGQYNSR